MQYTEDQKAIMKSSLQDAKWNTKLKPVLKQVLFQNIGSFLTMDKLVGRKDIIDLFDEVIKEIEDGK